MTGQPLLDPRYWPKWVHTANGSEIAKTPEEEAEILARARSHRMQQVRDIGRARANAVQAARADAFAIEIAPVIAAINSHGVKSAAGIAKALNARGITSPRGGRWQASQILRLLRRAENAVATGAAPWTIRTDSKKVTMPSARAAARARMRRARQ